MSISNSDSDELSNSNSNVSSKKAKTNKNDQKFIKSIRKQNPNLFHFNLDSSFIYEPRLCNFWYNKLSNKNTMKLNNEEIFLFTKEIQSINFSYDKDKVSNKILEIDENIKSKIINAYFIETEYNEVTNQIQEIITLNNNKEKLSCLKIAQLYENKFSKKISPSHIWYIMKNKLNYRFLKTSVKTAKLTGNNSFNQTWFYLKVFARFLKLNGSFIFIDESSFYTHNNNYHQWRKNDDEIYYDIKDSYKVNLLMAINTEKVLFYKLTNVNTTGKEFVNFIKELLSNLEENEKKNSLFILDNCKAHLTVDCYKLFNQESLKVLYSVPYRSNFNMIEYVFRKIKNITYKNLYSSIEELKTSLNQIINSNDFNKGIKLLFKETIMNYISFNNKNKNMNLN